MIGDKDLLLQAGVAGAAVAFLREAVLRMVPYTIIAIPLIVLDLVYGIRAARYRKERIRFSTAVRRTMTKILTYACWIILSSALAIAFEHRWLEWVVLGMVYINDSMSVYRVGTEGSWTSRNDRKARIKNRLLMIKMLDVLDSYTGGKYRKVIGIRKEMFRSDILLLTRNYKKLYSISRLRINLFRLHNSTRRVLRRWLSFI